MAGSGCSGNHMVFMLASIFFGFLVLPIVAQHIWPGFNSFFNIIWEDPTDRAARRMLKKSRGNHVLPEMSATGEIEILAAQTGAGSDEIKKAIGALTAEDAVAIFQAIRSGKPLAIVKIMKVLGLIEKAPRMPRGYN